MIERLIDNSLALISDALASHSKPIILWSGGADSQVVLWLARQVSESLPVFFFREPFQEPRFAFNRRMVAEWNLQVFTAHPLGVEVIGKGDFIEIVNVLRTGENSAIYLPTGINDSEPPRADWECGVEVALKPTTTDIQWHWDLAMSGHRGDDADPIQGALPLADSMTHLGETDVIYPLIEWTRADIWEASERFNIPQNLERYDAANGFKEFSDRSRNPDYMDICVECMKPGESEFVTCPQLGASVPRIANQLNAESRARSWRQTFVNIEQ